MGSENIIRIRAIMDLFGLSIPQIARGGEISEPHLSMALAGGARLDIDFYRTLEANLGSLVEGRTKRVFGVEPTEGEGAPWVPASAPIPPGGKATTAKTPEPDSETEAALARIARDILDVPTLERRQSDSLDFHDLAVWSLRDALLAAHELGRGLRGRKRG